VFPQESKQETGAARSREDAVEQITAFLKGERWAVAMMTEWARQVAAHEAWGFETPDDVVQATLLALVQNFRRGGFTEGNLRAYVRRIAKNMCVTSYRRTRVRGEHVALEDVSSRIAVPALDADIDRYATLKRVLERMGEDCRRIVILAYVDGYSREEIGSELGISIGAVRTRLFRCLQSARSIVEGNLP